MKKLIIPFLVLFSIFGHSQEVGYAEQFARIVQVPNSPEAEAFSKYGEIDANLFTGTPNISIPLYTIKGKEMDFPISLTYDASGIKVRQIASSVGLGWNLNVGGRISRQTRGMPDHKIGGVSNIQTIANSDIRDQINDYMTIIPDQNGGFNATAALGNSNFSIAVDNVEEYYKFLQDVQKGKIDIEQDYFSLNVMGLNETLWMDTATYMPKPLNDPNLKVLEPHTAPSSDPSYWKILDSNGNTYYFGLDLSGDPTPYNQSGSNPIERVRMYSDTDTQSGTTMDFIYQSSWLLSKIVSSNGKDVYHFEYTNNGENYSNPTLDEMVNQSITHGLTSTGGGNTEYSGAGSYPLNTQIKSVRSFYTQEFLKAIYHNGRKVVSFELGNREDIESGNDKKITGFTVYDDQNQSGAQIIKQVSFEQSYFGAAGAPEVYKKRLKLDKVSLSSTEPENHYSFIYNSPSEVPNRVFSNAFDEMGYYNGLQSPTAFKQFFRNGSLELPGSSRAVVPIASKVGILEKLVYPTGGSTEFIYENHNDGTDNYPGLRIKALKNYSDNGSLATHKEYEYIGFTENFDPKLDIEITSQPSPCDDGNPFPITPKTLYRYMMPPNTDGGPHVSYSEVKEYNYDGSQNNGYIKYTFNTGDDSWTTSELPPYEKSYDSSTLSGKPSGKEVRDKNGNLQLEELNEYEGFPPNQYSGAAVVMSNNPMKNFSFVKTYLDSSNDLIIYTGAGGGDPFDGGGYCPILSCTTCNPPIIGSAIFQMNPNYCDSSNSNEFCFPISGWASLELKKVNILSYRVNPVSSINKEYFPNAMVESSTSNDYSQNGLFLNATSTIQSDGSLLRKEYTYPLDIPSGSRTAAENQLITDNKLYQPIVTKTIKVVGLNTTLLSTERVDYAIFTFGQDSLVLPKKLQFEKGGSGNNLEDRIIYNKYDSSGNPIDVLMKDGSHTCYIWGYDHRFPVAKIENVDYSQIPNVGTIEAETNETALLGLLDQLRAHTNLAGALVTTYTYKPLIGVSTITDPFGNKTNYIYDSENKLKYVLDQDNKVVGQNEYHYRSKEAISGAYITEIGQGNGYMDFEVNTQYVVPSGLSFLYSWSSENGTINGNVYPNDPHKIRIDYSCISLDGQSLQVSCLISDANEIIASEKVSKLETPDSCIITGSIVVDSTGNDGGGNFVLFKIENLQGGDANNTYNWDLVTDGDTGQSNGGVIAGNKFKVYYDCNLMMDYIRVSCYVSSSNGAQGTLYGEDAPCEIGAVIGLANIDNSTNMLTFNANAFGGHPDGFTYYWSYVDTNCVINEGIQIGDITFPFNDGEGNYYLNYQCGSTCGGSGGNNFPLDIYLTLYHSNGGAGVFEWVNNGLVIPGTCIPQ